MKKLFDDSSIEVGSLVVEKLPSTAISPPKKRAGYIKKCLNENGKVEDDKGRIRSIHIEWFDDNKKEAFYYGEVRILVNAGQFEIYSATK